MVKAWFSNAQVRTCTTSTALVSSLLPARTAGQLAATGAAVAGCDTGLPSAVGSSDGGGGTLQPQVVRSREVEALKAPR